ncbi:MAG: hypothetical protein JNJ87_11440 [Acinetobacter junii]|nr:hypothetical protein [Acinetobacter junii]
MKTELAKYFEENNLINVVEINDEIRDLFINGATCSIYIGELNPEWSIEEIDSHFTDVFEEQNVICKSIYELEVRFDFFKITSNETQNENLYFLIEQNSQENLESQNAFFLTGMVSVLRALESYKEEHRTFISNIKEFKISENPSKDFTIFLNQWEEKVRTEYEKHIKENNRKIPNHWMIGNGIFVPDTLVDSNDHKDLEIVIYCNEIAIQWLALSCNIEKFENVSEDDLKGLQKFINEMKENYKYFDLDKIRLGSVAEYKFRKAGNYFINELSSEDIEHYFEEVDYNLCIITKENDVFNFEMKKKVQDGYNTGGIFDAKDMYEELSKVTDMTHIEFIAEVL